MTTSFLSQWQWNLKAFSFTFYMQVNNQHTTNSQCSIYLKSLRDYFVMAWINICETELLELNGKGRVSYRQDIFYNVTHRFFYFWRTNLCSPWNRGGELQYILFCLLYFLYSATLHIWGDGCMLEGLGLNYISCLHIYHVVIQKNKMHWINSCLLK